MPLAQQLDAKPQPGLAAVESVVLPALAVAAAQVNGASAIPAAGPAGESTSGMDKCVALIYFFFVMIQSDFLFYFLNLRFQENFSSFK